MISASWSFCRGTPRRVLRLDTLAFWQTTVTHYIWYFVLQVMWFILERKESAPSNKTESQIHLNPAVRATCIELTETCFILVFQSLLPSYYAQCLDSVSNDTQLSNRENEKLAFSWHCAASSKALADFDNGRCRPGEMPLQESIMLFGRRYEVFTYLTYMHANTRKY